MAKKISKSELHAKIKNVKLPILILDNRWHELFTDKYKTERIYELEQKLNNLLKRQGKLINEIQDMKKLKKRLIKDIMMNMDTINEANNSKGRDKKLDKNKQYINELNERINQYMDELGDIPYLIKDANAELVCESSRVLYERLIMNKEQLNELNDYIIKIRDELKQKLLLKQDIEESNSTIYTYMHDLLGVEVMDILDKEYAHK